MKVKMLQDFNGLPAGAIAELPDGLANSLIASQRAMDFADVKPRVYHDAPPQNGWISALKNAAIRAADGARVKTK